MIDVELSAPELANFAKAKAESIVRRSIRRTATGTRKVAAQKVRSVLGGARVRDIKKRMRTKTASSEAVLDFLGTGLPIEAFRPVVRQDGVSANIKGRRILIRGAWKWKARGLIMVRKGGKNVGRAMSSGVAAIGGDHLDEFETSARERFDTEIIKGIAGADFF